MPLRSFRGARGPAHLARLASILCAGCHGIATGESAGEREQHAATSTAVVTQHNDNARTGGNTHESVLTTSNVNADRFGKLFEQAVDGDVYTQPLYLPSVAIPNAGTHNVVFVATMHNTVYAFDADDNVGRNSDPLWQQNFGAPVPIRDVQFFDRGIDREVGILSTPAIDPLSGLLYVVSRTRDGDTRYHQWLHALDVASGAEKLGGPVELRASVPGDGLASVNGAIAYDPKVQNQRPALLLSNGNVYIASASHDDTGAYHGWILAYSAATLTLVASFNDTPHGGQGGIWQAGQGPTADADGNIYALTGNGTFDANTGGPDYGNSAVKLSPALTVLDWFTPSDVDYENQNDLDLGSAGLLAIPGTTSLLGGGKEGVFYLLDSQDLGHFHATDQVLQEFQATAGTPTHHIHGGPVYWKGPQGASVYVWGENDFLKDFSFDGTRLATIPAHTGTVALPKGMPGGFMSVSSNGAQDGTGIVWASHLAVGDATNEVRPGILHAFDAADVRNELWNSEQRTARDQVGYFAKFCPPTIANGKVYIPTFSFKLGVYGLLPLVPTNLRATGESGQVSLQWTGAADAVSYDVYRGTSSDTEEPTPIAQGITATNFVDTAAVDGITYSYQVAAVQASGTTARSNERRATAGPLVAWLKADAIRSLANGSPVGAWVDSSGHGNTAVQNVADAQPVYISDAIHGNPAVRFNAISRTALALPRAIQDDFTVIAVMQSVEGGGLGPQWYGAAGIVDAEFPGVYDDFGVALASNGQLLAGVGNPDTTLASNGGFNDGQPHVVSFVRTRATGALSLYVDGASVAAGSAGTDSLTTPQRIVIGGLQTEDAYFSGDLAEVQLYSSALSDSDRQSAERTLAAKYAIGAPPTGPVAAWSLDEAGGTVAADATGGGRAGTLVGAASWVTGVVGTAVQLAGTDAYVDIGTPVVDTTKSYSIGAWVRLDDVDGWQTVLSQDGTSVSAFYLQRRADSGRFSLSIPTSDIPNPPVVLVAQSTSVALANVWYYVVGVWDQNSGEASLYLNGVLQSTTAVPSGWSARGSFAIGRAKYNGNLADFVHGTVDDVRVYTRALSSSEVAKNYTGMAAGDWPLDENIGAIAGDSSANAANGTLMGGATWTAGVTGAGVSLDGSSGYVNIGKSVLNTSHSYTVTAWVNLSDAAGWQTFVSQDGVNVSSFFLQKRSDTNTFSLSVNDGDAINASATTAQSHFTPAVNVWYHLAGVYDQSMGVIRLYINGALESTSPFVAGWNAPGHTEIGRGRWNGASVDFVSGKVDGVRAFSRVLTVDEIAGIYRSGT